MIKKFLLLFLIVTLLLSCRNKKDLTVPPSSDLSDFYPLKKGSYYVYRLEEKHYSSGNVFDSSGFLKVSYVQTWTDAQGGISFKAYRYKKFSDTAIYKISAVWSATSKEENKSIVTENNIPFIKLHYPLSEGRKWDGNAFNTLGTETYTAVNVGQSWSNYPSTVTIVQRNDTNLLSRDFRTEVYALNVGLIYKETRTVKYSGSVEDFGKGIIVDGVVIKQKLLEYGIE